MLQKGLKLPIRRLATLALDKMSVYKHREARNVFPKPLCVSFDAFETLVTPTVPVAQQYYDIAKAHGVSGLSLHKCEEKFSDCFSEMLEKYPNYGLASPQYKSSDAWWARIVESTLGLENSSEKDRIVTAVLRHFTTPLAYKLYPDVLPTFRALKANGIPVCVLSNTDSAIATALTGLGLGEFISANDMFFLYDIGVEKPLHEFFAAVAERYADATNPRGSLPRLWHVGDSFKNDMMGAAKSGWNGVLVDRSDHHGLLQQGIDSNPSKESIVDDLIETKSHGNTFVIADNRVVIRHLTELLPLFGVDAEK